MSNSGNQPPGGTPPASKPGDDDSPPSQSGTGALPASTRAPAVDESQTPPASSSAPDSSPPASTPAPASTPPDSAPASAPASAPDSQADAKPPDSAQPPSDASPPSSQAPDSKPPDSDGCAEIPTAAHAVLTAEIKLAVQLPYSADQAAALTYKFTLSNDDSSYSKTLATTDCQPGSVDGTSLITFEDLTDGHSYTLVCDDGQTTYTLFQNVPYDQVMQLGGPAADGSSATGAPAGSPSTDASASDAGGNAGADAAGPT